MELKVGNWYIIIKVLKATKLTVEEEAEILLRYIVELKKSVALLVEIRRLEDIEKGRRNGK